MRFDPVAPDSEASSLTLGSTRAPVVEQRVAAGIVAVLLLASVLSFPFSTMPVPAVTAFIAIFGGITATTDVLTAILLFGLYRIDGRRTVLATASAYLLDAFLTVPYVATFPSVMGQIGVIGTIHSAAWLWLMWHAAFPLIVALGVMQSGRATATSRRPRNIATCIALVMVIATILTLITTLGDHMLPPLIEGETFFPLFRLLAFVVAVINVGALVITFNRIRPLSSLHLWIVIALTASVFDTLLNAAAPGRYHATWYVGKIETLTTASVVLVSILVAWSSLYARAAELAERLTRTLVDRRDLRERFEREHTIAEALQKASLPRDVPHLEGATFSAVYRPAIRDLEIGGDWYDAFELDDGRLALSIGDVAGKGLGASIVMGRMRQTMRVAASLDPDPYTILALADRALRADDDNALVTAFVALVDPVTGTLAYASAGHPPPLIYRTDGTIDELTAFGLPLGLRQPDDPATMTLKLGPGDLFVAYTDGLVEATHDLLEGTNHLRDALARSEVREAPDPAIAIFERVAGDDARDDVAVITLSLTGTARSRATSWRFHTSDAAQASSARRKLAAVLLARGGDETTVAAAELTFGELVGNAVRYAPGPLEVKLEFTEGLATLHVIDRGRGFSNVQPVRTGRLPSDPLSESGRGLFIVSACTQTFELAARPEGGSHAIATFALPVPKTSAALSTSRPLVPHER